MCPSRPLSNLDYTEDEDMRWFCQTNANQSQFVRTVRISGGAELTPLGESGSSAPFEDLSAGEAAFLVEVVVDG